MSARVIVESPLAGDVRRNLRYLLWCCRAVWVHSRLNAVASHLVCPWFLDDAVPEERAAGIAWEWMAEPSVRRWFFVDLGMSPGMVAAKKRYGGRTVELARYAPECWGAFVRGEWPPHTAGFELAAAPGSAEGGGEGWARDEARGRSHYFRGGIALCGRCAWKSYGRPEAEGEEHLRCSLCAFRERGRRPA